MQLTQNVPTRPQTNDDAAKDPLSSFISKQWQDLKTAYWMYHSSVWEALLFYAGNLWIRYDTTRRCYEVDAPEDEFTPRPRINRFAGAIDAVASNFQVVPEIEAVATPLNDLTRQAVAEVANDLAKHFIKDCALRSDYKSDEDKVSLAGQWFTLAGCFGTNVYVEDEPMGEQPVLADQEAFNVQCADCDSLETLPEPMTECPNCGSSNVEVTPTVTQAPQLDELGQPMMEPVSQKRVRCLIDSPLAYYPKAGAKSLGDAGMVVMAERMDLDRAWSELGIELHEDAEYPDGWNLTAENALAFWYLGYSNASLHGKDAALVLRIYCEPQKMRDYPEGFYAIFANGKVQRAEPWPFGDDHPLTKFDFKALPTSFFARSVAFDLAGLQRELSEWKSIIKLHGMTGACEPIVIESSSNVSEITGRGDKVIQWTAITPNAKPPERLRHEQLSEGVFAQIDRLEHYFDVISQAVSVYRGEQPGAVTAGVALETLRSQAEFMFAGPVGNWNNGWKETVRKGVKLMQQHYDAAQLSAILGENRETQIQTFISADLDECLEWISTKHGLPRTRDEKRQEMIELFDRGALDINDPGVKEKAFELFGETGMLSTFSKDATRARYENAVAKQGLPVTTFMPDVDDSETHLAIHGDQIKAQDFLNWPPEGQQLLLMHYSETKAVVQMLQAQQAALAAGPNQPGAPAPQPEGNPQ